jgi:2-methylcitrate dehydratase PrpD
MEKKIKAAPPDVTGLLAEYISRSGEAEIPSEVTEKAKLHILDSLAAVIFGSALKAGRLAARFVREQGGVEEARVAGTSIKTSVV